MAAKKKGKLGAAAGTKGGEDLLYSAHQIWQAGLGALARAQAGAPKVFEDLMREGSKLQGGALDAARSVVMQAFQGAQKSVNRRVDEVKVQAGETWDNLERVFQSRVQRALHQLGMPTAEEIGALARKVEELSASVEKLAAANRKPRAKAARKGGADPAG